MTPKCPLEYNSYWVYKSRYANKFRNKNINPIPGGGSEQILFRGVCAILHTPTNFWTTGDTELKFYMVIDIRKLFSKVENNLGWIC